MHRMSSVIALATLPFVSICSAQHLVIISIVLVSVVCSAQVSPVRPVRIPVFVTNHEGEPLHGLNAKDFVLESGNQSDKIIAVNEVKPTNMQLLRNPPSGLKATNIFKSDDDSPRHMFLLFIDEPHLIMPESQRANLKHEAISALARALDAGEQGGLASYDGSAIVLVHDFASSPDLLFKALQQIGFVNESADTRATSVNVDAEQLRDEVERLKAFLEGPSASSKPANTDPLWTMASLAEVLAGVPGNKALIWCASYLPFRLSTTNGMVEEEFVPQKDLVSEAKLIPILPTSLRPTESQMTFRVLARAGVALYPVHVGGKPSLHAPSSSYPNSTSSNPKFDGQKSVDTASLARRDAYCSTHVCDPHAAPPNSLAAQAASEPNLHTLGANKTTATPGPPAYHFEQTFDLLAEFTGGSYRRDKNIWGIVSETLRRTATYYNVDVAVDMVPLTTSFNQVQVHASQNVIHVESPRIERTVANPVLPDGALANVCALPMTGIPFVVSSSAKSGASQMELVVPRAAAATGNSGHLKLRIGVIPQGRQNAPEDHWHLLETNVPSEKLVNPIRHRFSTTIPQDTSSLCVYVRNEETGALGSTVIHF